MENCSGVGTGYGAGRIASGAVGFRDRFFTPATAKALLSWRLVLGGAAVVVAALLGLHPVAAVALGVGVYIASVGTAMPKTPRSTIDPFAISEPWRHFVQGTQRARQSLRQAVNATSDGPLKARLVDIANRLEQAVEESWAIAKRGDEIDAAVNRIDPVRLRSRLGTLKSASAPTKGDLAKGDLAKGDPAEGDPAEGDPAEGDLAEAVSSVESQLASADRLKALSATTADRLRLTQARLDELVARAAEVSIGTTDTYEHDVDNLVVELEGLRLAVAETNEVT